MNELSWNYDTLIDFIYFSDLTLEQYIIVKCLVLRMTSKQISKYTGLSTATVDRRIKTIKDEYNKAVEKYPEIFTNKIPLF